jgi:outer membrane receptor protein involved in Fe transport
MGNAYLRPEYVEQYNLGFLYDVYPKQQVLESFHIGTDIYYNYVKDKIIAYPKGQQFRWTMLNLGEVDIRGLDITAMATFRFPDEWRLTGKLQYTYQEAIDITNPADTYCRDQIPYIPWNSGSVIAMINRKSWSVNYSFIYVGERYNQQENIRYNYTQPWYTSDISIAKSMEMKSLSLKISAEINNLMSQDYDVILNYPMPKRNYRFRMCIEI